MFRQPQQHNFLNIRVPLIGALSNRSDSPGKDQRFVNIYPETRKVDQIESIKIFLNKRPGLTLYKNFGTGEGRGIVEFNNQMYVCIGEDVFVDDNVPTSKITLPTSTGLVSMINCNSSVLGDYLFICDGISGWVIDTAGTVTQVVHIDFPNPHIISPTFIDGYVFLAYKSDIYNCDLDDPFTWNSTNFISSEIFPDPLVALSIQNNQVVALGTISTEFFFDAANASGSPLSVNPGTVIQVGCAAPHAVYSNERYTAFIGQSDSGGRAVWFIDGFKPNKTSDEYIERILDAETDIGNCSGYGLRVNGHMFYVLNLITVNRTLVYDIDEKLWHEWSSNNSGEHSVFNYNYVVGSGDGFNYLLHNSDGDVYKLDTNSYIDADHSTILIEIDTNKYDFDSYNRKFMSSLFLIGDQYVDNTIDVSWSDDDYQSYTTPITLSLSDTYPVIKRLGSFRRRSFKLQHNLEQPLRLEALEVSYKLGDH